VGDIQPRTFNVAVVTEEGIQLSLTIPAQQLARLSSRASFDVVSELVDQSFKPILDKLVHLIAATLILGGDHIRFTIELLLAAFSSVSEKALAHLDEELGGM
jgi:hypothetical protein